MSQNEQQRTAPNQGDRARAWCFTINVTDFADSDTNKFAAVYQQLGGSYLVCGKETAPTTGQRHYQGYIFLGTKRAFSVVRRKFHEQFGIYPHFEASRGTPQQNTAYCTKSDEEPIVLGEEPRQGSRSDLAAVAESIINGASLEDVAVSDPGTYIRYHGGIQAFHSLTKSKRRRLDAAPTVYWWFGPTGVGKSLRAYTMFPEAFTKMNNQWWDGYQGENVVLLDDYRPALCPFQDLLRILDRYPYRCQVKGSSIELSASVFVITTTQRPEVLWHKKTDEQLDQLLRRITSVEEFHSNGSTTILKDQSTTYVPLTRDQIAEILPPEPIFRP